MITAPVQTTGKPGSPSATTTLPGNQLPAPAPKFGGVSPSATLDKLAANGLHCTAMHNAALCSPTRAATISGRNHHSMGSGRVIAEIEREGKLDNTLIIWLQGENGNSAEGTTIGTPNTKVAIAPWNNNPGTKLPNPLDYEWELYDLRTDWTQYADVSKKYPEKLKEMQALFVEDAWRYNVFPLDNEGFQCILQPRPSGSPGLKEFSYDASISIALGAMPPYVARDFTMTAEIDIPKGGAEGMLITEGGRFDGWGLYMLKGKPVFTYNMLDVERFRWESKQAISPGRRTVVFDFDYDGPSLAKGGTGVLKVDGEVVAEPSVPHTTPALEAVDERMDVGYDTRTGDDQRDYEVPFRFTGAINKITFKPGPPEMTEEQMKQVAAMNARGRD